MTWLGAADVIASIQSNIGSAVTIYVGAANKALNIAPPAINAYLKGESYTGPQGAGGAYNARALHTRFLDAEFHSWGVDIAMTEQIHFALVTAIRVAMSGANYRLGSATWVEPQNIQLGAVLVLPVQFVMALPQQTLPLALPGVDAKYQTATITSTPVDTTGTNLPLYAGEG